MHDIPALILLCLVAVGTLWWALREFIAATRPETATRHRRMALYHALLLEGTGMGFAAMALLRLWPALPVALVLVAFLPSIALALAVRLNDRLAAWLLTALVRGR